MTSTARVSSRGREAVAEQIFQATTFFRHTINRAPGAQICSREDTMALCNTRTWRAAARCALTLVPVNTAATEFSASGSVLHMLGTNEIPVILLQADASANFTLGHCSISGVLFPQ
jgi:hypothetical protein